MRRLPIDTDHTAVVVMHAWNHGSRADFPGWYRAVEYIPRSNAILRDVFPPLLNAVRAAGITLFHVVGGGDYYRHLPGYRRAVALAEDAPALPRVPADSSLAALRDFRAKNVFVGEHNQPDVDRGFAALDFPDTARPLEHEGIAEDAHQLTALCRDAGVNHLIYAGFAVNWCSPRRPVAWWICHGAGSCVRYCVRPSPRWKIGNLPLLKRTKKRRCGALFWPLVSSSRLTISWPNSPTPKDDPCNLN
ncbi:MAG: hypothetical protein R2873_35075 [Caldilineaceae bacterium]